MKNLTSILTIGFLLVVAVSSASSEAQAAELDKAAIEKAAGVTATVQGDVVRIGWSRDDVPVTVDGMSFPPAAGLGSWAAFKLIGNREAMMMGDTVVFQDEVNPAMDAAFAHGLKVTALHNHFFYDDPKVYFMHIDGHGDPAELARGVKAVWDAIKQVRAERAVPAESFPGDAPNSSSKISIDLIQRITGLQPSTKPGGVVKVSVGRTGRMHGMKIGGAMGLGTWAAFTGSDKWATIDGDFIMTATEVQPVLRTLREHRIHIVALHNHMMAGEPNFYFTHYWGKGPVKQLANAFKAALEAQKNIQAEK